MKKLLLFCCIAICAQIAEAQAIRKVKIYDVLKMMDTATTPLVVNFWASWCKPCVQEIPWFEKSVAALKDKKVRLVLVSLDFPEDYPKGIQEFAKKNGYQSRIVWLDETNADYFCPKIDLSWQGAIPATVLVNNKKKFRKFYGQQLPEEKLKLALLEMLE
ncbi:MAG: TlpA family protein disulfide reductase [Chitinophagales bacterium]|nr:TlpA family protein disulfide reductase [Chitinophagales bacterium]